MILFYFNDNEPEKLKFLAACEVWPPPAPPIVCDPYRRQKILYISRLGTEYDIRTWVPEWLRDERLESMSLSGSHERHGDPDARGVFRAKQYLFSRMASDPAFMDQALDGLKGHLR